MIYTILVAKTKALISFAVTAKLICAFVFAYEKCFSHDMAYLSIRLPVRRDCLVMTETLSTVILRHKQTNQKDSFEGKKTTPDDFQKLVLAIFVRNFNRTFLFLQLILFG